MGTESICNQASRSAAEAPCGRALEGQGTDDLHVAYSAEAATH